MRHDPRTDIGPLDLGEFEHKGVADMLLLDRRLAYEELSRLAVMVGEAFRTHSLFGNVGGLSETGEATNRVLARSALRRAPAIGFIIHKVPGLATYRTIAVEAQGVLVLVNLG